MINFIITVLKVIFLLGFLIFIHEGGHFIVAKLCKIKVKEFAIGFGPTIWRKQGKETKYTLRLIPLGGFVNLEGEEERSREEGSFSEASIPKRMAIIVAGGLVNIIFGLAVYFILMTSIGNNTSLVVSGIIPEYAAEQSGIVAGDEIVKINNKKINVKSDIDKILQNSNGEELKITIRRAGEEKEILLTPTKQEYKNTGIYAYYIGVQFEKAQNNLITNMYYAVFETRDFIVSIADSLKMLFTGNVGIDQMMGPVGISEAVANTKQVEDFVYLMALISLSLGVTNLLPFPALDGGKFALLLLEAIRGKKLNEKIEINLQLLGFAILMLLALYVTYNDILRIF